MAGRRGGTRARGRLAALFFAFIVASSGVAVRLLQVQALEADRFVDLAEEQRIRRVDLAARRGSIFDRDLAELAISLDRYTVYANPRAVADPNSTAKALSPLLDIPVNTLEARLSQDLGFTYLVRKADPEVAQQVASLELPGVDLVEESKRFYPAGSLAAQVLGFVGLDNEGLGGLESSFDEVLRGRPGEIVLERDPRGRAIPAGRSHHEPPIPGEDLILTIDREIQYAAEKALRSAMDRWSARAAMAIVMDPRTGELLAVANMPAFDPNDFAGATDDQLRNRALTSLYEPGSVNKLVTAAAALESGVVTPQSAVHAPDRLRVAGATFRDWRDHPDWDLSFAEVIGFSSNVGTIKVAMSLGAQRLHTYLGRFGYGRPTGLDFPGEPAGILPDLESWWRTSLPTIAIGQGVAATPLQVTMAYATVANQGVAVTPTLVRARLDGEGNLVPLPSGDRIRVIGVETADALTRILLGVTEGEFGTGKAARVDHYQVAGKTATAQIPLSDRRGYSDAILGSFVGFAPAGDPRLVVSVMLEDPKPSWGGFTAGSTFKEIMEFSLRHLGIGPGPVLPSGGAPLPVPDRSGDVTVEATGAAGD